ncbi:MAG: tripartite tricarboxylate transporter TctB family protein [Planctomycetota bacterium]|jgi:hypothetical protein
MDTSDKQSTLNMRNKDVLFALILVSGSVSLIVYALSLSVRAIKTVNATFYDAPGFSMLVISGGLLILSLALLVTAVKQGGTLRWLAPRKIRVALWNRSSLKTLAVFVYLFLYMIGFGQRIPGSNVVIPFWLATFVFLVLMMTTFKAASISRVLIISGLCTLMTYLVFGYFAKIPLP